MNPFKYFKNLFSGNATGSKKGDQSNSPNISAHEGTLNVGIDSALQVSTVWACVALIVETISSLPVGVFRTLKDGQRESMKGELLYQVLHTSPNKRQTSQEFWEQMLLNFVLRGNAYARIERNKAGDVISLWPMSADQMQVIVADNGSLVYVYSYDNVGIIYTEKEIFHLRGIF